MLIVMTSVKKTFTQSVYMCIIQRTVTEEQNCNARHMDLAGKYSQRFCNFAGPLSPYEFWPTTSHAARWIPPSDFLPPHAAPGLNVQKRPEEARTRTPPPPPPPPPSPLTGTGWRPPRQLEDALKQLMPMQKELSNFVIKAKDSIVVGLKEAAAPRPQPASSPSTADDGGGGLLSLLAAGDAAAGANTLPPPPPLNFSTTRKFSASPLDDVDFDFDFVAAESVRTEPSWPVTEISNWAFPAQQDQIQPWERREKQANLQDLRSLFDEDDPMIYFGGPQTQRMDLESGLSSTVPTFVAPRMEQMQPAFYVPPGYYESRRRMMRHFTTTTTEPPPLMREEDFYQPTLEAPIDLDLDFDDELPSFESNRLSQVLPDYPEYERFRRTFQREGVKGLWNQLDRFQKSRTEIGKQETVEKKVRPGSGVHLGGWERNPDLVFRDDFRGPNELPANLGSLFSLEQQHELLHPNSLPPRSQKLELPSYDEHLDTFRAPISVPKPTSTTTTMRSVFGVRNPFLRSKSREREPPSARPTPRLRFSNPTTARPTATTATPPTPPPSYTGQRYYSEEGTTEDSYGAPSAPLYYSSTDRYIQTPRTRQSTYWDEIRSCCNDTLFPLIISSPTN